MAAPLAQPPSDGAENPEAQAGGLESVPEAGDAVSEAPDGAAEDADAVAEGADGTPEDDDVAEEGADRIPEDTGSVAEGADAVAVDTGASLVASDPSDGAATTEGEGQAAPSTSAKRNG